MIDDIVTSLLTERTVDIITTGRRSGEPRTTEIWTTIISGDIYICGAVRSAVPRTRDWLRNLRAHPEMTLRLKTSIGVDLAMSAEEITDTERRRAVYAAPETAWYRTQAELDTLTAHAPLVQLQPNSDLSAAVTSRLAAQHLLTS